MHFILSKANYKLRRAIIELRWRNIFATLLFLVVTSWLLLRSAGEPVTEEPLTYLYWVIVTISTVGYGDYSVETAVGKGITLVYIIPFGLSIFGSVLAKMGDSYFRFKKMVLDGHINLNGVDNHILIFGWMGEQTRSIISLIREDNSKQHIALVSAQKELEHPISDLRNVDFVKLKHFLNEAEFNRLALKTARSIVVNSGNNAENHLICVALTNYMDRQGWSVEDRPHIVVYSSDIYVQNLLTNIGGKIEVVNVFKEHILSRSALFAGSSSCTEALVDPQVSATQFSVKLTEQFKPMRFMEFSSYCKEKLDITVIGVSPEGDSLGNKLIMNPCKDSIVETGMHIFYVASKEIKPHEICPFQQVTGNNNV